MAEGILATSDITLPTNMAQGIWRKAEGGSAVVALSQARPMLFGNTNIMTLDTAPKAEFIGEGQAKSGTSPAFGVRQVTPRKAQVTMRFNEEVKWADEDYQLEVLQTLADAGGRALYRGLDIAAFHAINPLAGTVMEDVPHLTATTNKVTAGDDAELDIEAAAGLVVADGFRPTGIALDNAYSWTLSTSRYDDGRKKFPEISLTGDVSVVGGLQAYTTDTVSAIQEALEVTDVKAVVGDWETFAWGIQRDMPVKLIEYGDPDGKGDLQRNNQIAMRLEMVFGWAFLDLNAFAVIKGA